MATDDYSIKIVARILVLLCFASMKIVLGRSVPARQDLCARFPTMAACSNSGTSSNNDAIANDATSTSSNSKDDSVIATSKLDKGTYCKQYQEHFNYYCANSHADSRQATMFCQSFSSNCNGKDSPANDLTAGISRDDVKTLCDKYDKLAQTYCTGSEPGNIKSYCDLYRQYCVGKNGPGATESADDKQQQRYCGTYKPAFVEHCANPTSDPKTVQFCMAYNDYCHVGVPVPSASSGPQSQQNPAQAPTRIRGLLNANNSAVVRAQCDQYKFTADTYCPGYEVAEMRQNCNAYRVYCQGKPPFPGIDGNIGWNNNVWGVAGIPFYPFNPQGAIAGGSRSNVGYGDWGGSYTERNGVSDFYDTQRKVDANWQKGNYMYTEGWNVPLTGISGFSQKGVTLSGLGNPSDWPALQSGGLPIPAFGNGLGPLPNFGGGGIPGGGGGGGIPFIGK